MKKETAVAAIIVVAVLAFVGGYVLGGFDSGVTEGSRAAASGSGSYDSSVVPIGDSPVHGADGAPITLVFFADFTDSSTAAAAGIIDEVAADERFGDDLRLVVKVNPGRDADARTAAAAALFAAEHGRFFDGVYESLVENADSLDRETIDEILSEAGLDTDDFEEALASDRYDPVISADTHLARGLGISRAPAIFVNGRNLSGSDLEVGSLREAVFGEQEAVAALTSSGTPAGSAYAARTRANIESRPVVARRVRGGDDDAEAGGGGRAQRVERRQAAAEEREARRDRRPAQPPSGDVERLQVPVGDSPVLGPDDALITIAEFSDFHCPFCSRVVPTMESLMEEYGGDIRVVFKQNPLPMHPEAPLAHMAALAAHEQGQFWGMHDLIFENQRSRALSDYQQHARTLGLDLDQFNQFIENESGQDQIEADQALARQVNARGTPHFFVNGRRLRGAQPIDAFRDLVESELALANQLMEEEGVARGDIYEHLMEGADERATAEPARPSQPEVVDPPPQGDSFAMGPDDAPITIHIFSEFQCPFCGRAQPTLEQIREEYGDQVRFVFKSFPLPFHENAHIASQAAYAAGEQGQFWEYHDLLFENQRALSRADLEGYAEQLGLDMQQFREALDSERFAEQVDRELAEGRRAGVSGTPTFLINGERLVGAVPFDRFRPIIERHLEDG